MATISFDCETTGLDLYHAARPFFVTMCIDPNTDGDAWEDSDWEIRYWEWDVNPKTRVVTIPDEDKLEIRELLDNADRLVGQNMKFDVTALEGIGVYGGRHDVIPVKEGEFPWHKADDTLIAGHMLYSARKHDLTSMVTQYLNDDPKHPVDIKPFEKAIDLACEQARRITRKKSFQEVYGDWAVAKKGREGLPSAKEKCHKMDMWLPLAIAKECEYPPDHPWYSVLEEYSNADSEHTLALWYRMERHIASRKLEKIYRERMRVIPIGQRMERNSVTGSIERAEEQLKTYKTRRQALIFSLTQKAKQNYNYKLVLPDSGSNESLNTFVFRVLQLPILKRSNKTGAPSLDKDVLENLAKTTPPGVALDFVTELQAKRKCDTSIAYLQGYSQFWLEIDDVNTIRKAEIQTELQEGTDLLELDGRQVQNGLRKNKSERGTVLRSQDSILSAQGTDSERDDDLSSLRQSELRKSRAPIPRDGKGQLGRQDEKREICKRPEVQRGSERGTTSSRKISTRGKQWEQEVNERKGVINRITSTTRMEETPYSERGQRSSQNDTDDIRRRDLGACNGNKKGRSFKMHPFLNPTGTVQLRWSSSNPNSQNISKQEGFNLRYSFGPLPDREWWSLDYQNLELRIPTFESRETALMEVFLKPKEPPYYGSYHLVVFDVLHPEKFKQHGKDSKDVYESNYYQWVKNGNFAMIYGCGKRKADATYKVPGAYDILRERFPNIARLSDRQMNDARKYGYVQTIPDKTVDAERGFPIMASRTDDGAVLPTTPLNYHVSGTACWCTAKAMVRTESRLKEWERDSHWERCAIAPHIKLQVHDELVFDFPKSRIDPTIDLDREKENKGPLPFEDYVSNLGYVRELQREMEKSGDDIGMPLPVGVELNAENWSEITLKC